MVLGTDLRSLGQKRKLEARNLLPGRWRKEARGGGRLGEAREGEEGEVSCSGHSLRLGWGGADNGEQSEHWATFTLLPSCPEAQELKQVRGCKKALRSTLGFSCPVLSPPMVVLPKLLFGQGES